MDEKGSSPKKTWEKGFDHRLNPEGQACGLLHSPLDYMSGKSGHKAEGLESGSGESS